MRPTLSYCGTEVYREDYDRFLMSLFVPAPLRETLLSLYALDVELDRVHGMVREEMIGHIRYAWWYEAVEKLAGNAAPRGHPVLEALSAQVQEGRIKPQMPLLMAEHYREHFPKRPPRIHDLVDQQSLELIRTHYPQAEGPWEKARGILARHRRKYGEKRNGWLRFKLLLSGLL